MKAETDTTRRQLGDLAVLAERTAEDERRILAQAEEMLTTVEGELEDLRVQAPGDERAASRYEHLLEERGRLQRVIAQARQTLEPAS